MATSVTVSLHIGKALPSGNERDSDRIIALWQEVDAFFDRRSFTSLDGINGKAKPYKLSLDASDLLARMRGAREQAGSFSAWQKAHVEDAGKALDGALQITVSADSGTTAEQEAHEVATVFIQQLVLTMNIMLPGAIQTLGARFTGTNAHRYEAQQFDSRLMYGALRTATQNQWPKLTPLSLEQVWAWLEHTQSSAADIAITDINKALFTLLKVAEQRHEYSARTVLLVLYQLEVLLDCRHQKSPARMRRRAQMALGEMPESADSLGELYEVRYNLFHANAPVHRPPLICHTTADALRKQLGQHNTAVESGTALVIALLQDLINNTSTAYVFRESLSRKEQHNTGVAS